jgi:Xaa-Pro aminopeptidase
MDHTEALEKDRRIRDLLRAKGLKGLLLKRQANFSWLTAGGINLIGIASEIGGTSLLITAEAKYVISSNIEAPRMIEEEAVEKLGYIVKTFNWWEDKEATIVRELLGEGLLGCDVPYPSSMLAAEDVVRLRYSFTPAEIERYRWLADKTVLAAEKTMLETRQGEKECAVIGRCAELWKDRIDPVGVMGAADDRIARFRHPIPMERPIDKIFMLSVNARRGGLVVCLTRFVHFGKLPETLRARYEACVSVECVLMANTRPGRPIREVLQAGVDAYREKGYPEEWQLHHQGGSIGYQSRDYRALFTSPEVVQLNQPFCWNPTITGTKSEDTILAAAAGPEIITKPALYPTFTVEAAGMRFVRAAILESSF